jgi:protein-S-isoprenylcysteine O-methyltransferase Ste14
MLIEAAALVCGILSLKQAGIWSFLGLESFKPNTSTAQTPTLMTGGFYRFVRHPLYLFSILFIWFVPLMTWNILAFDIGSTIYMFIGSIFEERKLAQDFGQVYIDYQKRVPSFLPRLIRKP